MDASRRCPDNVSLDRLGRNVRGVLELVDDLEQRGVGYRVLHLGLDTSTPSGRLVLTLLLAVAQLKRDHLSERTRGSCCRTTTCPERAPQQKVRLPLWAVQTT